MEPVEFEGQNCVYAEDQPEYLPLPAHKTSGGTVISCWKLSLKERVKIFFTGRLWFNVLTFNQPLQPQLPSVDKPQMLTPTYTVTCSKIPGISLDG
jgi:hypothetical protein